MSLSAEKMWASPWQGIACFVESVYENMASLALSKCSWKRVPERRWYAKPYRLSERQRPNGGLNGRPEKLEDVCTFLFRFIALCCCALSEVLHRVLCPSTTRLCGLLRLLMIVCQVCYSWWCLSALQILGRLHWIDKTALTQFILSCQVEECIVSLSTLLDVIDKLTPGISTTTSLSRIILHAPASRCRMEQGAYQSSMMLGKAFPEFSLA